MTKTLQEWAGPTKIVALVFTDIVDSTRLGNSLGDEKWIDLLQKHFAKARRHMLKYDCHEIKIIGDSFMVVFRTALEALDFALAFNKDTGSPEIKIRIGIHVGPVRIVDNDIFGTMVNYTKRVEAAFEDSGIVLSSEAKTHIDYEKAARHSTIRFKSSTKYFKGFDTPQILWRVRGPEHLFIDLFEDVQEIRTGQPRTPASRRKK